MKRTILERTKRVASTLLLAFIIAALFFIGMSVEAQTLTKPGPRQGYYLGIGAEAAADGLYTGDTGWVGPHLGPMGAVHVGQVIVDTLSLGLHIGAGAAYSQGRRLILGNVSFEAKWSFYKGFFLRPSVGFGFADITRRNKGVDQIYSDIGGRYHLAAGYDFFPFHKKGTSGGVAFTPIVWASVANATNLSSLTGGIGFEITFFTGLPKNQLDLEGEAAFR